MINQIIYNINFANLRQWLIPSFLRKSKMLAWIAVFTSPFETLHISKQEFRASIRYKLQHNGKPIYLEKVLNEYYNIAGYDHQNHQATKQIYIGPGENLAPLYVYTEAEDEPLYLYTEAEDEPKHIYKQTEIDEAHADFTILVPTSLTFIEAELRALVDYYINTKIYKIITY